MQKPSVLSFLITLLLSAAVCTNGQEVVKDTDGNPVYFIRRYFIQPVKTESNNGGGLVPAATNILPICPLGISQSPLPDHPGVPVTFFRQPSYNPFPPYMEPAPHPQPGPEPIPDIPVETNMSDLVIEFRSRIWPIWPVCNEFSKLWEVDVSSSAAKEPAILIGGDLHAENVRFTIVKAGEGAGANTYKLTTPNGTVGTTPGAWLSAPQLILTNDNAKTLLVKFSKVDDATTATTSTSRVEKLGLRMFPFY